MAGEAEILNRIRIRISSKGTYFRATTGNLWAGKPVHVSNGVVTLNPGSRVKLLVPGFSDLFGITPIEITPEMVGQTVGVFTAIEVKSRDGRITGQQVNFINKIKAMGGIAGVARSEDEAEQLLTWDTTSRR